MPQSNRVRKFIKAEKALMYIFVGDKTHVPSRLRRREVGTNVALREMGGWIRPTKSLIS